MGLLTRIMFVQMLVWRSRSKMHPKEWSLLAHRWSNLKLNLSLARWVHKFPSDYSVWWIGSDHFRHSIYTTFKSLGLVRLVKKKKILTKAAFIWQKIQLNRNIAEYYYNLKKQFSVRIYFKIIYSCDAKLNFQHHYSSLQCHMILQKSFIYADLVIKKHLLLLLMLKTVVPLNIFVKTVTHFSPVFW